MKKMKLDIQRFGASINIYAEERNVNIANNTSDLYLSVSITTTGSTYNMEGNAYFNISAVGQNNSHSVGNTYYTINRNSTVTVYQGIIGSFYHNADGTLNPIAINVYSYVTSSTRPSNSASCNMTTIPRATPTINLSGTIGSSVAINISPYSTSFRHDIRLEFGDITEVINMGAGVTSTTYTLPTSFYAQIPDTPTGNGQVIIYTYNGNDLIGTSSGGALTVYTDENACRPDLSLSVVDTNTKTTNLTGNPNVIVLNRSTLEATIIGARKNSATLKTLTLANGDNRQEVSLSGTTLNTTMVINNPTSGTIIARLTDSRNYTKEISLEKETINYTELFIDINFFRDNPTSDKMFYKIEGTFWNGDFGAYTNAILNAKWRIKSGTTYSAWTNLIYSLVGTETVQKIYSGANVEYATNVEIQNPLEQSGEWDYQKAYEFEVLIEDRIIEIPITKKVVKGKPIFNWYEDNDENYFNVNGDILMNNLSLLYDIIYPVGSIYISVENVNPQTYMSGTTWVAFGGGRALVGVGSFTDGDGTTLDFPNVEYSFGEYLHTVTESEMPSHKHDNVNISGTHYLTSWNSHTGNLSGFDIGNLHSNDLTPFGTGVQNSFDTQYTGGSQGHNTCQPSITVYMWKRTN